ncbi:hypothetical protein QJ850_gp027 [Acanthamoeba polyphaga mimivirus]|uniref:Uncharacterized protein n=1 Tax=Acanthamoeba polyphaga mimivirus Kroon TaxID=3069720 RepID=A0A0G2Y9H2_9VIRU|nr:hypothetical protein QJ850_gp027 [Acanthamoeba polyphaga mimivirus]AKI79756.1 hypothetical protein [Acanthamoeba polyphaga mimivirus Kroon]
MDQNLTIQVSKDFFKILSQKINPKIKQENRRKYKLKLSVQNIFDIIIQFNDNRIMCSHSIIVEYCHVYKFLKYMISKDTNIYYSDYHKYLEYLVEKNLIREIKFFVGKFLKLILNEYKYYDIFDVLCGIKNFDLFKMTIRLLPLICLQDLLSHAIYIGSTNDKIKYIFLTFKKKIKKYFIDESNKSNERIIDIDLYQILDSCVCNNQFDHYLFFSMEYPNIINDINNDNVIENLKSKFERFFKFSRYDDELIELLIKNRIKYKENDQFIHQMLLDCHNKESIINKIKFIPVICDYVNIVEFIIRLYPENNKSKFVNSLFIRSKSVEMVELLMKNGADYKRLGYKLWNRATKDNNISMINYVENIISDR